MTSYGGQYYDHLKELRYRSGYRVFEGLNNPLGENPNWHYVTSEHFKYLFYKQSMKIWRATVKTKALEIKLRGKMV